MPDLGEAVPGEEGVLEKVPEEAFDALLGPKRVVTLEHR